MLFRSGHKKYLQASRKFELKFVILFQVLTSDLATTQTSLGSTGELLFWSKIAELTLCKDWLTIEPEVGNDQ